VGAVDGVLMSDMIGLAPDIKVNYTFLGVKQAVNLDSYNADGIAGLSPLQNTSDLIDYLFDAGHIKERIYAFYFDDNQDTDILTNNSYLLIGEIPKQYANNMIWQPVVPGKHWVKYGLYVISKHFLGGFSA